VLDGDGDFLLSLCGYVLAVGLVEEAAKALPLLWRVRRFGVPDWRTACLWGLASGIGFGVAESVYHAERGYNGLATADAYLVRFASCVALHAVWSASVGMGLATGRGSAVVALAYPAALHGLYDVVLLYQYHVAALVVAVASFGWLAWQIETARTRSYPSNSAANDRRNGSASLTIPTV
jgi:RsiW-degrading membrane proteinase PrsW (M82 family)